MTIADLLNFIFGDEPENIIIYDEVVEIQINDWGALDEDQLLLNMPDAELDLCADGLAYAVVTDQLPKENAAVSVTKDGETLYVYLLETPIDSENVPETWDLTIPVGIGWRHTTQSEDMYELADLMNFKSVEEKDQNDTHNGSVPEISVPAIDEAGAEGAGADTEEIQEPVMLNDAEVLGEEHPDMAAFLEQPMVFMAGDMYGQGDRRNTYPGKWKRIEWPLIQWMNGPPGSDWGLTKNPVGKSKGGSSIVPSENIDGERKDSAVKTMYAIGIDIDSGTALDDTLDKLEEAGYFALVYTTYSHRKTRMELKSDAVLKALKLDEAPTKSQIQEFLHNHHKDNFSREFIAGIEVVSNKEHTADGLMIILDTPPLDKYRVIFPLAEPVDLADLGPTMNKWKEAWADLVTGVAVNILDAEFDSTSCDVNRLFYLPRHPEGAEFYNAVVQGKPLSIDDIKPFSKDKYVRQRKSGGDPFLVDTGDNSGPMEVFNAPSGMNLNDWHRKAKERFLITDVLETFCDDKIRKAGGERSETTHIECPYEHEHSSTGGTATMAMNPDANKEGVWTVFCHHDSCQGRNKLDFLAKMMEDEWFDEEVLTDDGFLIPLPDQDIEESEEVVETRSAVEEAKEFDKSASEEDITKFLKRHHKMGADKTTKAALFEVLNAQTYLGKTDLKAIWSQLEKEKAAREASDALADLANFEGMPLVNIWGADQMMEWARLRIQALNAAKPTLFHYMEGVARVIENSEGRHRIRILSEKEFGTELNKFTKWQHQVIMGEQTRNREVFAPKEVVENLYNDLDAVYPVLRAVTASPMFTFDGEMVMEAGYHSSGIYYAPDITMDMPMVSDDPTEEEVIEAKRLLIEEVLADFPFAGLDRDKIVAQALFGEGVPAITHVICMLLLFFVREMVDGPTPAHLIGKPTPGTGASLLVEALSIIATGDVIAASELPSNTEELSKSITAFLAKGAPMIFYDNINHNVDSGGLAMALTSSKHEARILGKSETVEAHVRCVWALTGNNVQLSSELLRRCCLIDLDAQMENPEEREGWRHQDIRRWCRNNRGQLVWACLTLIQNWIADDKPHFTGRALNSYENWSYVMGGICESAGLGGFLGNREDLKNMASDGRENDILYLLEGWWSRFLDQWAPVRQSDDNDSLISMSVQTDIQLNIPKSKDMNGDTTYNASRFEEFLTKYQNRVFRIPSENLEVKIEKSDTMDQFGHKWRLVPLVEEPVSNIDG